MNAKKVSGGFAIWKKILAYAKAYRVRIVLVLIAALLASTFTVIGPKYIQELITCITEGMATASIDAKQVGAIGMLLIIFYSLAAVFGVLQNFLIAKINTEISRKMRSDISHKINRLPMAYFSNTTTGDILSTVTNDVDTISQSFNQSISMLVTAVTQLVGAGIMMFVTNWIMAFAAIIASSIGFVAMVILSKKSQRHFNQQQSDLAAINGHIDEVFTGHTVVSAFSAEEEVGNVFSGLNGSLKSSVFKANTMSGLMTPIMTFVGNFAYIVILVVGGFLALNGQIGLGVIVAFMLYIRYFTSPLSNISQSVQSLQSAAAAAGRVFDFLEAEEMEDESEKKRYENPFEGEVGFDHIKFGYAGAENLTIKDFSLNAHKGQKIAIVGPTGAGKSTLVNLLMRFYEINGGKITLDGIDEATMTRHDVRAQFCMVLQDTWVFEGTVKENLVYCNQNAPMEDVEKATKAVGLDHFVETLSEGYDTVLSDKVSLSQGQKQQLTIARAMIANKPMLILDEATSSVDTRTEIKIQEAMDTLTKGRTSFVIAHRLSTIKNSDLILVLNKGDIIEQGTHDELMAKNGFYADLYNSQFVQA